VLLHAAAFDPVISRVALIGPYSSYRSFVDNSYYNSDYVYSLVPGALTAYDLPDLAGSLAHSRLLISGTTDSNSKKSDVEEINRDTKFIKNAYKSQNAGDNLKFIPEDSMVFSDFLEWAK